MIFLEAPGNLPRRIVMLTAADFSDRRGSLQVRCKDLSLLSSRIAAPPGQGRSSWLDDNIVKDIGLDRSEIGSALMDDAQKRLSSMR